MRKFKIFFKNLKKEMQNNIFLSILPIAILVSIVGSIVIGVYKTIFIVLVLLSIPFIKVYGNKFRKKIKHKTSKKSENKEKKQRNKIINIIINIILILIVIGIIGSIVFMIIIVKSAPDFNPDNLYRKEASIIYDNKGNILTKLGTEIRDKISYNEMPEVLVDAILATEDARFNQHNGFDLPRFLKASLGQVVGNSGAGGASTITMQVVKNNFTSTDVSIKRKFTDIYLAIFKLEKKYSKEEILEFYVNAPFLGANSYGVAEAARNYFGKEINNINLSEAALLAGLFQAPGYYDPYINPEIAQTRRTTVLYLMRRHGYISKEQEKIANSIPVKSLLIGKTKEQNKYQGFIDTVIIEAEKKTGKSPYNVPMNIYSTLDTQRQDYINDLLDGKTFDWVNDMVQSGIAVTNTKTGEIVALGSGRNLKGERVFNFATMLNKQSGSTAKTIFSYAPGIENENWSSYTPFVDEPYSYSNGGRIRNWDGGFMGFLTLKQSLGLSRNIPAVKAFQKLNNKEVLDFVLSLGMKPEIEDGRIHEAHALGAYTGTNPLQMAAAYASFANDGYFIEPYTIKKIQFIDTKETKEYNPVKNKVMEDSTAYIITDTLRWAVDHGMSSAVKISGYEIAAKTGTTNFDSATAKAYKLPSGAINDMWTVGYSPDYSVAVWYGYDKIDRKYVNTSADHPRKNRLFRLALQGMLKDSRRKFTAPNSVVLVDVEKNSIPAKLPSEFTPSNMITRELFKKGAEPTEVSERYKKLSPVTNLKIEEISNKIKISWEKIDIPTYYTDAYMEENFKSNYGSTWRKHLDQHKSKIKNEIGVFGYEVFQKDANGNLVRISHTTNNYLEIEKPTTKGLITYVVKTSFSKFKNNASSSSEINYENKSILDISIVGGSRITLKINDVYNEPIPPLLILKNDTNITNETSISKVITKKSTNTTVTSIDTSTIETFVIKYFITYKDENYNVEKTIEIK